MGPLLFSPVRYLRLLLIPISAIYSVVVFVRNRLYDWNILKSFKADVPTIVVGNLSTGGTGKTPHVEYLLRLLSDHHPSLLSRGYGRKTKGFIQATANDNASTIGDEPFQVFTKFPGVTVAVCEDRLAGLKELSGPVILDDAFQHRRLRADLNILLTDYSKPWWNDIMLPAGDLRDNVMEKRRADIIIVTKCPDLDEKEMQKIRRTVDKDPVFFTTLIYEKPVQLCGPAADLNEVVGFSGIARPGSFEKHLRKSYTVKKFKAFGDHHVFTVDEILGLWNEYQLPMITTEKDSMRIRLIDVHVPIYYIPIEVKFLRDEKVFQDLVRMTIEKGTSARRSLE